MYNKIVIGINMHRFHLYTETNQKTFLVTIQLFFSLQIFAICICMFILYATESSKFIIDAKIRKDPMYQQVNAFFCDFNNGLSYYICYSYRIRIDNFQVLYSFLLEYQLCGFERPFSKDPNSQMTSWEMLHPHCICMIMKMKFHIRYLNQTYLSFVLLND